MVTNKKDFREASDDLFRLSGILDTSKKSHSPYIVLNKDTNEVDLNYHLGTVLDAYSDDTEVMWQWGGQWRSDFFTLTVGEIKEAIEKRKQ